MAQEQKAIIKRLLGTMGLADTWRVLQTNYDLVNFVRIERLSDGLKAGVAISARDIAGVEDEEIVKRIRNAIATALRHVGE